MPLVRDPSPAFVCSTLVVNRSLWRATRMVLSNDLAALVGFASEAVLWGASTTSCSRVCLDADDAAI